jgi:hypothetical protein
MHKIMVVVALALFGARAYGRLNPLQQIVDPRIRPQVLLMLDNSGSMRRTALGSMAGSDCLGPEPVDLCKDGRCTGAETLASCAEDCLPPGSDLSTLAAGSFQKCGYPSPGFVLEPSRLGQIKRVLRNVLPDLRQIANVGLVSFGHTGYYQYHEADPVGTKRRVTLFLTEWELKSVTNWTQGKLWSGGPKTSDTINGTLYTLLSDPTVQADPLIEVDLDSLYRREDAGGYSYARFKFGVAGLAHDDGSHDWQYVGSYYSYEAESLAATATTVKPVFMGPRYSDGTRVWIHRRYDGYWDNHGHDMAAPAPGSGFVYVPLIESDLQVDHDNQIGRLLGWMNEAGSGGFYGVSRTYATPTAEALDTIRQHLVHRGDGSCADASVLSMSYPGGCPFSGTPDPLKACRKKVVVVLSDGKSTGADPVEAARRLYCLGCNDAAACVGDGLNATNCDPSLSNPTKTFVVGIPGLPDDTREQLHAIADVGNNGVADRSAGTTPCTSAADCAAGEFCPLDRCVRQSDGANWALFSDDEKALTDNIRTVISGAITGDFVTSAAGASASRSADWALVPSTEYPGWKGHLRAYDLTGDPEPILEWDAADQYGSIYSRRIFTGHPTVDAGAPVEILNPAGDLAHEAKIRSIWRDTIGSGIPDTLDAAGMTAFFRWLYGEGGTVLHAIVNCVPATVGPPQSGVTATDHDRFAASHASRETLIYVTSNVGLIHAFRSGDVAHGGGEEAFAVLPAPLLDAAYRLYVQGGQRPDPAQFKWVLANSPRVGDVYNSKAKGWSTQLVVPLGPRQHGMVVLDITQPTDCTYRPCRLAIVPFTFVAAIRQDGGDEAIETRADRWTIASGFGEGWSVPSLFWSVDKKGDAECHAAMGSGYGAATSPNMYETATKGHYYHYFDAPWSAPESELHDAAAVAQKVDYAVLANTSAIVTGADRRVLATYQADLGGRIVRYEGGVVPPTDRTVLVGPDADNPFYYSAAVLRPDEASNTVVIAANSGSADEADPPSPSLKTQLYLRSETDGAAGTDFTFTCPVDALTTVSASCDLDNSKHGYGPSDLPGATARPVGPPMLLSNDPGTGRRVEVLYTVYERGAVSCESADGGTSYLIRVSVDPALPSSFALEQVVKLQGRVGGMSLGGGGTRVVLSRSAIGDGAAMATPVGGPVDGGGAFANTVPRVESWREVR